MKKIVVQCIAKLQLGGAQKRVIELLRETRENGYLITGEGGKLYDGVKDEFKERHITIKYFKRELSIFHDFLSIMELRDILIKLNKKSDCIVLHTHGSKAGVLGRLVCAGLPFCQSLHTIHGFAVNPYINPLKRFIYLNGERIASLFGDTIIAQAKIHIDKALKWGLSRRNSFYHIPNFIDVNEFKFNRKKSDKEIVVGTVGNFKPQKNPLTWAEVALKVVSMHDNVKFIYAGDGILREKVEKRIQKEDRVQISGWVDEISGFFRKMDIFFLPSRWEGMPRTILEAMASGIPVVASSVDGSLEVVREGETGFLVGADDVGSYIDKLVRLIENPDERLKMGLNGRKRVESHFSYTENIKKTLSLYDRACENE